MWMMVLGEGFQGSGFGRGGVGVRGKNTMNLFGLVRFQMPNRNPKRDIKKAVKYTRRRLENKGYTWYLNLVGCSVDKKTGGKDRARGIKFRKMID